MTFWRNSDICFQENAFENVVCEIASTSSRPQWVKVANPTLVNVFNSTLNTTSKTLPYVLMHAFEIDTLFWLCYISIDDKVNLTTCKIYKDVKTGHSNNHYLDWIKCRGLLISIYYSTGPMLVTYIVFLFHMNMAIIHISYTHDYYPIMYFLLQLNG